LNNILTIDVEEYYHVGGPGEGPSVREVRAMGSRVGADVDRTLRLLSRRAATATFFVLGEVALAHPELIARIEREGHEIGSHGFRHVPVDRLSPEAFGEDLDRSLEVLGGLARRRPRGYRAPIWSIGRATWGLDLLIERGFMYDSSFAPVPPLGAAGLPYRPGRLVRERGSILELPPLTARAGPWRYPVGFALGLRLAPLSLISRAIARDNAQGQPAIIAFHPWELDPDPPVMRLPVGLGLAHGFGLERMPSRLDALLRAHRFTAARDVLPSLAPLAEGAERPVREAAA
jgi:polysaccharide deacetylase family protein (PEP-CTERM system associated)